MPLPWVGYVRVSHVGGRDGDSFRSPDDQSSAIEGWVRARGDEVVVLPAELDASGGDRDRPILAEAVAGIERGEFRGLVVAYLSRASRSVSHLLELWDRIEAAGGQVIAVSENIDTSTPAGRLTRTMLAAIAEHELDLHRERFDAQRASATDRGIWQRAIVPIGYDKDSVTRRLVLGEAAPRVRAAFDSARAGLPMAEIALALGVSGSGARYVLANRVYRGELRVGEYVNLTAHPALVSEEVFAAAQRPARTRRPRRYEEAALLAGLARCSGCGSVMSRGTPNAKKGAGARGAVYACPGRFSQGRCPNRTVITCHLVDDYVEALALEALAGIAAVGVAGRGDVDAARVALADAEHELTAYVEAVSAADVGAAVFGEGARARSAAVDGARGALSRLLGVDGEPVTAGVVEAWPELSVTHRNRVLRGLIECVTVRRGRVAVGERAQVVVAGAGVLPSYVGGSVARELAPLEWLAADDPRLLGV
jgi:DNA invertase Pin-like site-specific DNA recombinase